MHITSEFAQSIVEEMEKQKQEIEALRLENERLKSTGGKAPSMLDQMAAMQKQLAEMMKKQQEQEKGGGGGST